MKTLCRILAVFFILSFLIGCAQSEEEVFDLSFNGEGKVTADYNGIEILYRSNLDSGNGVASTENFLGYTLNTEFSDLARKRVKDLEDQYNFKLNVTNDTADIVTMTAGGLRFADVFLSPSFNFFSWSKAGLLTGISTLSDFIDYRDSEKWGSPLILESMFYENDVFGLTPNAWPEQNYTSFGYPLIANVDLILANGCSNPRELVEAGVWVWDTFNEELDKNTITEGNDTRCYGLVTSYPYFAQMIILSNGQRFAMKDENGEYYCGYYTPEALRAMDEIKEIWFGKYAHTVLRDEVYLSEVVMRNFTSERGAYAFLPTHFLFGVYGEVAMELDNFAILPTPTGPDVDVGLVTSIHHTMYYSISFPVVGTNTDAAAAMINEIYEPLPGFETRDQIKAYMTRNYFFDERDADTFFELFENSYYNYDYTTGFNSRKIPEGVCQSTRAVSELLKSNESIVADCLTEYVIPTLHAYDVLYGDAAD